jgi:hypothetical protein
MTRQKDLLYQDTSHVPWIGGPGTRLPFFVESFLSWTLALSFLSVSGYHYLKSIYVMPLWNSLKKNLLTTTSTSTVTEQLPCWLELTTSSRNEQTSHTPEARLQQLVNYLQKTTLKVGSWTHQELLQVLQSSSIARRLASLAMRPTTGTSSQKIHHFDLYQDLIHLWPQLLQLPRLEPNKGYQYELSLILPAHREHGTHVSAQLDKALHTCREPQVVEVLIIDAGDCVDLDQVLRQKEHWGRLKLLTDFGGGGRGPCLNHGASQATGRIYVFCHSDTTLPQHWDSKIRQALARPDANSCAFGFGIDTSLEGLNGGPYPPGIKAIETTANWRTHLYSLPYGDQVLSIPADIFEHLGGFPNQCLMEDYELISLLRRRSALLAKFGIEHKERLVIVDGPPALCSPRRWQKLGVLYVTFLNSKLVNLYAQGMTPDDLFRLYYGRRESTETSKAAWERDLEALLG